MPLVLKGNQSIKGNQWASMNGSVQDPLNIISAYYLLYWVSNLLTILKLYN